jgi:preprotein translocase subunit SecE
MVGSRGAELKQLRATANSGGGPENEHEAASGACARGGETMAKANPGEFIQQVRNEAAKVTWPSRKEAIVTTAMVFVMVVLASVFFLVIDQVLRFVVRFLLTLGG